MDWLRQQYERYQKESRDWSNVQEHAERIYNAVWSEVGKVVTEAAVWNIDLTVNGFPLHHTVTHRKRILTINLTDDKQSIVADRTDGNSVVLSLDVCSDGSVCLKNENEVVTYAEAAQRIMEPFLFGGESPYAGR